MAKPTVTLSTYRQGTAYTASDGQTFYSWDPASPDGDRTAFVYGHMKDGVVWIDDCTFIDPDALKEAIHRMKAHKVIDVKGTVVK